MTHWKRMRVSDIAGSAPNALATGPFGSAISSRFFISESEGVPIIRGSNLSEDVGSRLNDADLVFVSQEKAKEFSRSHARRGDLVFTCWGTIGQVGLIDGRSRFDTYIVSNKQMKLTPDGSVADSLFLYYALSSPSMIAVIKGQAIGSSVPGFNLGQLRAVEVDLPPLGEQRRIAAVLGALDDKIELNRQMIRTLEEMAQVLFMSQFPFFRHSLHSIRTGLERLPPGWGVEPLADHFEVAKGISYKGQFLVDNEGGGVPMVNLNSVLEGGGWKEGGLKFYSGPFKGEHVVLPGDLVVANTEQGHDHLLIGCPAIVPARVGPKALFTHHLYRVRSKPASHLPVSYLYHCLLERRFRASVTAFTNGTTVNGLSVRGLQVPEVIVPPESIVRQFNDAISVIHRRIERADEQTQTLTALRDLLLPRLISGQLRVPESLDQALEALSAEATP